MCDLIRNPFSIRGVLAVRDDKVYLVFFDKTSYETRNQPDPGGTNYVSDEKNVERLQRISFLKI
ncbi:MAG: hypothetical protein ACLP05_08670 [Candidatus Kryptoniota bacterium]